MPGRAAVFVDRDDTILDTSRVTAGDPLPGDLYDASRVALIRGAAVALARLADAGFLLVVYTSQGGVARGIGTLRDCEAVNDAMRRLVDAQAARSGLIGPVYSCPFHPRGRIAPFAREHDWRKPAPGMILAAAAELGVDLSSSWAIGDKPRDCACAVAAGIDPSRAILVGTSGEANPRCADLAAAAELITG